MPKATKPSNPKTGKPAPDGSGDLERRYASIGIPAVAAAARYCAKNDEPAAPGRDPEDRHYDDGA